MDCGIQCLSQSILKNHIKNRKKCGKKRKVHNANNAVVLNRGQFNCSGCNDKFTDKSNLRRHQKYRCKGNNTIFKKNFYIYQYCALFH